MRVLVASVAAAVTAFIGLHSSDAESKQTPCKATPAQVREKRQATWSWQRKLGEEPTPTASRERHAGCAYLHWLRRLWTLRALEHYRLFARTREPRGAIRYVFKSYAPDALAVAYCESRLHVTAVNGQYRGLFQMGSSERQLFGHGPTALEQTRAAWRYFDRSGRDWSPWSCKP